MEAADCTVDLDGSQKEHCFSRLKFLWHTRASTKFSNSRGAGSSQNHLLSNHEYQVPPLENDNRARAASPLGLSDEPPTWDHGSPWRYSAIFDDILNGNIGEGWQGGNTLAATESEQDATSNFHTLFSL